MIAVSRARERGTAQTMTLGMALKTAFKAARKAAVPDQELHGQEFRGPSFHDTCSA